MRRTKIIYEEGARLVQNFEIVIETTTGPKAEALGRRRVEPDLRI
jgi:hypothetical protein